MPIITTRTTPNNTLLYVATCDYCGKEFAYPYQAQTENNVLSHMKYCKYKPREASQPTITELKTESVYDTPEEKLKLAEATIKDLWEIIVCESLDFYTESDETDYYEPLPYPTRIKKTKV